MLKAQLALDFQLFQDQHLAKNLIKMVTKQFIISPRGFGGVKSFRNVKLNAPLIPQKPKTKPFVTNLLSISFFF